MFGSSCGGAAAPPETAARCRHDGLGGIEREVLDDIGQEDRGELLAEVNGDADADPGELAPRQRGDREPESARLADREPAAREELGDRAEGPGRR